MSILDELPDIVSPNGVHAPPVLEPLRPIRFGFFIPRLDNKPQNPIIDALDLEGTYEYTSQPKFEPPSLRLVQPSLSGGAGSNALDLPNINISMTQPPANDIWMTAAAGSDALGVRLRSTSGVLTLTRPQNNLKTWDGVRYSRTRDAERGDLLSEQDPPVFVAAQEL